MTKPLKFMEKLTRLFLTREDWQKEEEELEAIAAKEQKVFGYQTLAAATGNFDPKRKLGEGGFGPVFKGRLADGREVAVKMLGKGSRQGSREFTNEAMLLSRVQHKNVVNLYGYCAHGDDLLLVYEYVLNESLDKLLFCPKDEHKKMELDWKRRYDIIMGVARGLQYLHEDAHTPIIHRDIKASNVLLDERWCPKIADFGMARLFPEDLTHVNTRVAGTNGYMAPEYIMHGTLSTKVDVFSFGVLVLELISGQKNSAFIPRIDAQSLLEWAWKHYKKKESLEIMDPAISSSAAADQVALCIHIGLLCTQSDPRLRPDMRKVVIILSKKPSNLEEPTKPGMPGSRYRRRPHVSRGGGSSYYSGESSSGATSASAAASIASSSNAKSTATTSMSATTSTFASSSKGTNKAKTYTARTVP